MDDVLNVSGHRLGTAEIESALVTHAACVEAAVVGIPHDIKGVGIFAYCILADGFEASDALVKDLKGARARAHARTGARAEAARHAAPRQGGRLSRAPRPRPARDASRGACAPACGSFEGRACRGTHRRL